MILLYLLRGGSWVNYPKDCRSAFRYLVPPADAYSSIGFRVACFPPEQESEMILRYLLRGGSWFSYPRSCRSACRRLSLPDVANINVGFRVVCPAPQRAVLPTLLNRLKSFLLAISA